MAQNPVFALAYSGDTFAHPRLKECRIERRQIGELVLTSGQIIACDPAFVELNPFARTVTPGRFPLTICIVRYADSRKQPDERIASAALHFAPGIPSKWETATIRSPNTTSTVTDYGVDSGTGCFMDADTARRIAALSVEDSDTFFETLVNANYVHTRSWGSMILDPDTGLNVIAFSSGWGDGAYTSYWGFDSAGEVVCLLTDFRVLSSK